MDPVAKIQAQDEAYYGSMSLQMAEHGDWLTPRFLDRYALVKPPLLYWLEASPESRPWAIGNSNICAFLQISGGGCRHGGADFRMAAGWEGVPLAAAAAGAILLLSSHLFFVLSRIGLTDALLTFETALAMFALARDPRLASRASLWTFGIASGAAMLTKGIAGLFALLALALLCLLSFFTPEDRAKLAEIGSSGCHQRGRCPALASLSTCSPYTLVLGRIRSHGGGHE